MKLTRITDEEILKVSNALDSGIGFKADFASENQRRIAQAQLEADQAQIPATERAAMERVLDGLKLLLNKGFSLKDAISATEDAFIERDIIEEEK